MSKKSAKGSPRRDYPPAPSSLTEWWQRIQWALNDQKMSARGLTRRINPDGAGQGTVGRWLAGDVVNASLTKILKAAEELKLSPRWLLFHDGKQYAHKPAQIPAVLEKVLLLTRPAASPVVTQGVIAFYEQHPDAHLPEEHWRSIRTEFERAERMSRGVVDFVLQIRDLSRIESYSLRAEDPPAPPDTTLPSTAIGPKPIKPAKSSKPEKTRRKT